MANNEVIWVRIKPRNEKKGLHIRGYSVFGVRFREEAGWYKADRFIVLTDGRTVDFGEYLRNVRNDNDNPESPLAFDVMSEKEARKLDADEKKKAEERANAIDARPVKPVDLRSADFKTFESKAEEEPTEPVRRGPGRPRKHALAR